MIAGHTYAACALYIFLHCCWGLFWLAPWLLTLTTYFRARPGRGGIIQWCLVLFSVAWLLHIVADELNLGF